MQELSIRNTDAALKRNNCFFTLSMFSLLLGCILINFKRMVSSQWVMQLCAETDSMWTERSIYPGEQHTAGQVCLMCQETALECWTQWAPPTAPNSFGQSLFMHISSKPPLCGSLFSFPGAARHWSFLPPTYRPKNWGSRTGYNITCVLHTDLLALPSWCKEKTQEKKV